MLCDLKRMAAGDHWGNRKAYQPKEVHGHLGGTSSLSHFIYELIRQLSRRDSRKTVRKIPMNSSDSSPMLCRMKLCLDYQSTSLPKLLLERGADEIGTYQPRLSILPGCTKLGEDKSDHESFVRNARNRLILSTISWICHWICRRIKRVSRRCSRVLSERTSWRGITSIIVRSMSTLYFDRWNDADW
jgi:hypothetical protein